LGDFAAGEGWQKMTFATRELRDALGCFATGVCVVTAHPRGHLPFGLTVNSFASVSLDPALILWSLQKNSECLAAFDVVEQLAVNVLGADQQQLSDRYAQKSTHELTDSDFKTGKSGCPVLRQSIASFECDVDRRIDGGDHIIMLSRVIEISSDRHKSPLVFYAGQYREIK
jgi:flavin reductase (DIM6/NTAB) family NADH-FMN oxidoreductase RutF